MLEYLYLIILVVWALLFTGIFVRSTILTALAGIVMMVIGVHIATNGLTNVNNLATQAFAILNIGLGFYALISAALSQNWR